jgi:hypothetical protein
LEVNVKKRAKSVICAFVGDCQQLLQSHKDLLEKMDGIEKRLFHDNGTTSMQTRIERHEQILKVLLWASSIVVGTMLTSCVMGVIVLVKWALSHGAGS